METEAPTRQKRERKQTAFLGAGDADDAPARKRVEFKPGRGTKLADIPNVAFRLSKISRKDDILKFIYRVLYKGVGKQMTIKKDIGEFSGWTFANDAEREAKESLLSRAFKDTLHEILDLFEVPRGSGADGKKEAQVARLMAFLDAPRESGKKSLAEAEEKKKKARERKRERTAKKAATKAKSAAKATGGSAKQAALIKKLRAENAALRAKLAKLTGKEEPAGEDDEGEEEEEGGLLGLDSIAMPLSELVGVGAQTIEVSKDVLAATPSASQHDAVLYSLITCAQAASTCVDSAACAAYEAEPKTLFGHATSLSKVLLKLVEVLRQRCGVIQGHAAASRLSSIEASIERNLAALKVACAAAAGDVEQDKHNQKALEAMAIS